MYSDYSFDTTEEQDFYQKLLAATSRPYQVVVTTSLSSSFHITTIETRPSWCRDCFAQTNKFLIYDTSAKLFKLVISLENENMRYCVGFEDQAYINVNSCDVVKIPTLIIRKDMDLSEKTLETLLLDVLQ